MHRCFHLLLPAVLLLFVLIRWPQTGAAQQVNRLVDLDDELRIAYVSNQDGDEDIYTIPWNGWTQGRSPVKLTLNDARDWNPAWSPDGLRLAFNSDRDGVEQIYIMERDGTRVRRLFPDALSSDLAPAWSPDGTQLAFVSDQAELGRDLYVVNLDGTNLRRLTSDSALKGDPVWSPDSTRIVFWRREINGSLRLIATPLDNPANEQTLSFDGFSNGMAFWAPNGSSLYYESDRGGLGFFQLVSADGVGNNAQTITPADINSGRGDISPDGQLIMYTSDQEESDELYLMNADGTAVEQLTDNRWSDHSPVWQPVVPANEIFIAQPTAAPTAVAEGTPEAGSDLMSMGQSAEINGADYYPISLSNLLTAYDITPWHTAGWRGQGRKIGVIDLGFGNLLDFEEANGLQVQIPLEDDYEDYSAQASDHGTRVMEIIHAVAPEAELYACWYDGLFEGFERCKDWLAQIEHVNIINHSAGLPILPLDGTNPWAVEAEDANNLNVLWVNSAGNFQQGFYSAPFSDTNGNGIHEFVPGRNLTEDLPFENIESYTGTIILTWDDSAFKYQDPDTDDIISTVYDNQTGEPTAPDFDLQIVNARGQVIAQSNRRQSQDITLSSAEVLSVSVNEPFAVQIIDHNGFGSSGVINMVLVTEYLPIDQAVIPNVNRDRTSVAPADSVRVLTVGAVHTTDRQRDLLAPYSSRGMLDTANYNKPDLSAYGEFLMTDESIFVGTSAASPVVAGAAALVWQANESYIPEQLRQELLSRAVYQPENYNITYGDGVLRLPAPPLRIETNADREIVARLVWPRAEDAVDPNADRPCAGMPTRFEIGLEGYVNYNRGLFMREEPFSNASRVGPAAGLERGEQFVVIDGPACNQGMSWWRVELNDGSQGWLGEADPEYYLIAPSNFVRAQLPQTFPLECVNAPEMEVTIGDRAYIDFAPAGGLTLWRTQDRFNVITGLAGGTEVHILGGPDCVDPFDTRRWYVRVIDGSWAGSEGWMSEAAPTVRWLKPWQPEEE